MHYKVKRKQKYYATIMKREQYGLVYNKIYHHTSLGKERLFNNWCWQFVLFYSGRKEELHLTS